MSTKEEKPEVDVEDGSDDETETPAVSGGLSKNQKKNKKKKEAQKRKKAQLQAQGDGGKQASPATSTQASAVQNTIPAVKPSVKPTPPKVLDEFTRELAFCINELEQEISGTAKRRDDIARALKILKNDELTQARKKITMAIACPNYKSRIPPMPAYQAPPSFAEIRAAKDEEIKSSYFKKSHVKTGADATASLFTNKDDFSFNFS
eukprot:Colp12_sorted_trinity150504_noHs@16107